MKRPATVLVLVTAISGCERFADALAPVAALLNRRILPAVPSPDGGVREAVRRSPVRRPSVQRSHRTTAYTVLGFRPRPTMGPRGPWTRPDRSLLRSRPSSTCTETSSATCGFRTDYGRPYDNPNAHRQIATAAGSVRVELEAGLDLEMTPVRFDFAAGLNTASVATALTCPSDAASRSCASHRSVRGRHWA